MQCIQNKALPSGSMSGSSTYTPKMKCDLVWPKSQENQNNDDSACQGSFNIMLGWWSHDQLPKIAKIKSCSPALELPEFVWIMFYSAPIVEIWAKEFFSYVTFSTFLNFPPWKQHQTRWFQHSWKGKRRGYNYCIVANLTQNGKCIPWKGQWLWQTIKVCLYTHICIYRHLCRSLLSQSSGIQAHSALQSPIFGHLWDTSIPWFRGPWGYPILEWYMSSIPITRHHGMENPYHTPLIPIPCHLPYHVTLYHTIWPHTIPSGVSGVLFTKYEKYFYRLQYLSIGLHLLWAGSSDFCCHFKLQVEAIGCDPLKTSSIGLMPGFGHLHSG